MAATGVQSQEKPQPSGESPKERYERIRKGKPKPRTPRTPSPTRAIEPGHVHYLVAEGILEFLKQQADGVGVQLDTGEYPPHEVDNTDPQRVATLTAHAVARIADRLPLTRRWSRQMEGQEKRAGLLSDVTAALWALYRRNPDAMTTLAQNFGAELRTQQQKRRAAQKAPANGGAVQPQSTGVPHA